MYFEEDDIRLVARTESSDFVNWTKAEIVLQGPGRHRQTHDMVVFPTGGVYIGLLGVMEFPEDDDDRVKQHVELAWSPDSVEWHRIQEETPFIGHTPSEEERYGAMPYDWGTIFASAPVFLDDEVRLYYGACDWFFFDWRRGFLAMATLRPDGWAGYEQVSAEAPAIVTTTPVAWTGKELHLTADVGEGGGVKVTLLGEGGGKLAESRPIGTTATDAQVEWPDGSPGENLKGKTVRLRFEVRNAKLYSFCFSE